MVFLDSLTGFIITSRNVNPDTAAIYKTTNGGDNWNNLDVDFGNYFGDLSAHNDTLYVSDYTMAPCIYRSTNGGANFTVVYGGTYCEHIYFLNGSTGWAAVGGFFLAKTTTAGNSWNTIQSYSNPIGNISFVNENTGWFIGGDSSEVWKSTNGGQNFRQQVLPTGGSGAFSIYMISSTNGWIGSISFRNYKTTDGANWSLKSMPIFSSYYMSFIDSLIDWSASGGVAKTTNGGLTYIGSNPAIQITNYSLKQNYPNPFNPVTNIQFELINSDNVELSVFDISGKQLLSLKLNELGMGLHSVTFDGSSLSSGVYFYIINILDNRSNLIYTNSKKMMLIK